MQATLSLVAIGAVALLACSDNTVVSPDGATADLHAVPTSAVSKAPVVTFADPNIVIGSSQLLRQPRGVSLQLSADMEPNTAASIWLVIFNNPAGCTGECGEDDLFGDAALPDVVYATGGVSDGSGSLRVQGRYKAGDNSGSLWEIFGFPAPGLIDARVAEIHAIVRSHGPWIPGRTDMTTTFNGGCSFDGLPDDPRLGQPGPNTCSDEAFAVYLP